MMDYYRGCCAFLAAILLCFTLSACGGSGNSPWRYDPGPPDKPAGLAITSSGNGFVSLGWPAASNAAAYEIYYSTSSGVTKSSGIKYAEVTGTTVTVENLTNDTVYYFVITSINTNSESAESNRVTATPAIPGPLSQTDLTGDWSFNVLVSGSGACWMRGQLHLYNDGSVTYDSFLDSSGGTTAPLYLFPALFINPSGHVRDAASIGNAKFHGFIGGKVHKDIITGTSSPDGTSQYIAILQKQVPGVSFSEADLLGFGSGNGWLGGGGAHQFYYSQISTGSTQEWEYALGQVGKNSPAQVQYSTITWPTKPATSTGKISQLAITSSGIVTESWIGSPGPNDLLGRGVMSADKTLIVGTGYDSGRSKYFLRIYQFINIVSKDMTTWTADNMVGTYNFGKLMVDSSNLSAYGTMSIAKTSDTTGTASFSAYADTSGNTTLPGNFGLDLALNGSLLNSPNDGNLYGKLSYRGDVLVTLKTESAGVYILTVGLKDYQ